MMLDQPPLWFILHRLHLRARAARLLPRAWPLSGRALFGVGAEVFSIGFGREIVGWTDRRGTRWKVGWLPLGGYVQFVGDMNPASAPAAADDVAPRARAAASSSSRCGSAS